MEQRFAGKVAMVTGAALGIGAAIATRLRAEGAKVAALDIEEGALHDAFGDDPDVFPLVCDVSSCEQVADAVACVVERFGRIDVLMNNAGITHRQDFLSCSQEGWLDVLDTNLSGVFYVGQAVARTMVDGGVEGHIVNTSSNSARKTIAGITPYGPSKAAVSMLTQVMALELAKYDIHVNAVAPGTSKTRITEGTRFDPERNAAFLAKMPFGRYGEIEEMVSVALFLASDEASFITGETIYEEGGFSLM